MLIKGYMRKAQRKKARGNGGKKSIYASHEAV